MVETQKKVEELKKTYLSWSLHDSDVRREGYEQAKLEAARNMLLANLDTIEQIATVQALPLKTVQQLAEQLKAEPVQAQ